MATLPAFIGQFLCQTPVYTVPFLGAELPPVPEDPADAALAPSTTVGSLQVSGGSYIVFGTAGLVNSAGFAAQDNSRRVRFGINFRPSAAPPYYGWRSYDVKIDGGSEQVITIHEVVTAGPRAAAITFDFLMLDGGTDQSWVGVTNGRLTALKICQLKESRQVVTDPDLGLIPVGLKTGSDLPQERA